MAHHRSAHEGRWQLCLGLCALLCACAASRPERTLPPFPAASATIPCGEFAQLEAGRPIVANTDQGVDLLHGRCVPGNTLACLFTLEVPQRSAVRVRVEASDFDAALALFAGPKERPSELACNDDTPMGDLLHARIDTVVAPGTYLLVVDSAAGDTGAFELFPELDPLPAPALSCRDVPSLGEGVLTRGSTRGGTNAFVATCAGGAAGPDHAYEVVVPEPSRLRVRMNGEFDAALSLRTACADAGSELACNDESGTPRESRLTARVEAGRYFVIADSFSMGQSGDYTLLLERAPEPAPSTLDVLCDDLDVAPVAPGYHELDTLAAAGLIEGSCGGGGAPERGISFDVKVPSILRASLEGAEFDAVLYVLARCRDEASELGCFAAPARDVKSDDEGQELFLERPLSPGHYTLFVDGAAPAEMGAVGLRFSLTPR